MGGRPGGAGGGRGRGGVGGAFGRPGAARGKQRKSKRAKRQEFDNMTAPTMGAYVPRGSGEVVRLPRGASLADFADKINANPASMVQVVFTQLGEMVTATQSCTDETLQLLGETLGYSVQIVSPEDEDRELLESFDLEFGGEYDEDVELEARPPVVTVMGHVDHGKTKLLDAIRSTDVVAGEAGGITQHIGAYQVHVVLASGDRAITFIDTPGHEAFTAMRARGAQVTDIAVLVVAADDGVKPQTIEALNHAKAADVPVVVAVNKVDKEGADPVKVRGQLTEYGLVPEEYGGDTMFVDVSAKAKLGLDELLEAIVLTADASLDLRAAVDVPAQGVAIEGHLDRGRGPVASVLVQRGTLHVGDAIVAGEAYGRVRAMLDENGKPIDFAGPARPAQVLGFQHVPGAGDNFLVVPEDRVARQIAERRQARERAAELAASRGRFRLEDILARIKEGEKSQLNLILKGDVSGSVEALEDALVKVEVDEEVSLRIIHRGVGAITENDVTLASASDAVILGFNVRPEGKARELAEREHVDVRYYSVIYQAIEDVEAALRGMLKPIYEEAQLGTAEDPRGLPGPAGGQCRRLAGAQRHDPPGQQGPPDPRRRRRGGQSHGRLAAAVQGGCGRSPRRLRVRNRPRLVQRHQGRRRDRDLRATRGAAQLMRQGEGAGARPPPRRGAGGQSGVDWDTCARSVAGRRPLPQGEAHGDPPRGGRTAPAVRGSRGRDWVPRPIPPGGGRRGGRGRRPGALRGGARSLRASRHGPSGPAGALGAASAEHPGRRGLSVHAPACFERRARQGGGRNCG